MVLTLCAGAVIHRPMNNTNALGTVASYDLSAQYAPGSCEYRATFTMFGIAFEASRLVRTDRGGKCDVVDLYIRHDSQWFTDYVGRIDATAPKSRVEARALHLLNVAAADVPADVAERFAALEF